MDLMSEVEQLSRLNINRMMVVEVCNNKIYRLYEDMNLNLRSIYRRSNELMVFEVISRFGDLPI